MLITRLDGSAVSRDDLRRGVRVAVFGVPIDTQTFRADLVALLSPP